MGEARTENITRIVPRLIGKELLIDDNLDTLTYNTPPAPKKAQLQNYNTVSDLFFKP